MADEELRQRNKVNASLKSGAVLHSDHSSGGQTPGPDLSR